MFKHTNLDMLHNISKLKWFGMIVQQDFQLKSLFHLLIFLFIYRFISISGGYQENIKYGGDIRNQKEEDR